jgi:putative phosphoribosyl transferase
MPNSSAFDPLFIDYADAARVLMEAMPLEHLAQQPVSVVAVSRGGVLIADPIAQALNAPLDLLLSAPLPAPNNPELPIAMVSETQAFVMHQSLVDAFGIDEDFLYDEAKRLYNEQVLSQVYRCRNGAPLMEVRDRIVLLVDVCIETGLTMLAALKSMIDREAKNVYLAVPVLDRIAYETMLSVSDGLFVPHRIRDYISIEYYYQTLDVPDVETLKRMIKPHE